MDRADWKQSEKKIARRVFDAALAQEYERLLAETRRRAAAIDSREALWDLRDYLNEQAAEMDRKFDDRYSQLIYVFGRLLHEKRIALDELQGLDEGRLDDIRHFAGWLDRD